MTLQKKRLVNLKTKQWKLSKSKPEGKTEKEQSNSKLWDNSKWFNTCVHEPKLIFEEIMAKIQIKVKLKL